jgi:hypothetical protein
MADPRRVAAALQYQQSQQDPFDAVPVADAPGTVRTPTPSQLTWMDRLNNLSAGLGTGITNQLEGYKQLVTHPAQSAKDMAQAVGTMVQNPSVIADALKGMGEKAISGSQGLGEVVGENMTLNPRKLAMALSSPKIAEMTVYHGSPHIFEKFDASKIGTGEGAQAYGHGLYVAESPDVAEGYKKTLAYKAFDLAPEAEKRGIKMSAGARGEFLRQVQNDAPPEVLARRLQNANISAREIPLDKLTDMFDAYKKQGGGSLYTVDLPDEHIERMLDWDKPLSEQPESVRKAFESISNGPTYGPLKNKAPILDPNDKYTTAGEAYRALAQELNGGSAIRRGSTAIDKSDLLASAYLRELGIPGIKYLDAGSRDGGKGTRNFVIFPGEEHNLKILERK